jgi:hypothetical protein
MVFKKIISNIAEDRQRKKQKAEEKTALLAEINTEAHLVGARLEMQNYPNAIPAIVGAIEFNPKKIRACWFVGHYAESISGLDVFVLEDGNFIEAIRVPNNQYDNPETKVIFTRTSILNRIDNTNLTHILENLRNLGK